MEQSIFAVSNEMLELCIQLGDEPENDEEEQPQLQTNPIHGGAGQDQGELLINRELINFLKGR